MNNSNNQCLGIWGWLWGHKFRARFDEKITYPDAAFHLAQQINAKYPVTSSAMESDVSEMYDMESTYLGDVCGRCGKIIHRKEVATTASPNQ